MAAIGNALGYVELYKTSTGQHLFRIQAHAFGPATAAFSPDGRILATGGMEWSEDSSVPEVKVWDAVMGRKLGTIPVGDQTKVDTVLSLALSPDGRTLAVGTMAPTIYLYELTAGRTSTLSQPSLGVWTLSFSPDGKYLATSHTDSTLRVWDVARGSELVSFKGAKAGATFSPDGTMLAVPNLDNSIVLYDVPALRPLRTLKGHTKVAASLAFQPDSRVLASAGEDETVRIWDVGTGNQINLHNMHAKCIAFSADGEHLLASDGEKVTSEEFGISQ